MKKTSIIISRFALLGLAAGGLCLTGSARAQIEEHPTTDNPHLRAKTTHTTEESASKLSQKDQNFILHAATGGAQEVEDGKVAQTKGKSAAVKEIGRRMVADHGKANKELVALAKTKGFVVSTSTIKPRNMSGANFDQVYLASMRQDHEEDIKAFQKEAQSGDDANIKAWAAKTLPTLKEHLAIVKGAGHK